MYVTKGRVVCREEDSNLRRRNQRVYSPLPLPLGYLGLRLHNDRYLKRFGATQFMSIATLGVARAAIFIFTWIGWDTQTTSNG